MQLLRQRGAGSRHVECRFYACAMRAGEAAAAGCPHAARKEPASMLRTAGAYYVQSAARVHNSSSVPGGYARGVPVPGYVQYAIVN